MWEKDLMETVKLGLLIKKTKVARCGEHSYPVLSITKQDGIIMQSEKFKKRIASADTSDYKIIPRGKLVQGIHIDEGNFGIQDIVDNGIVSPAYGVWDVNDGLVIPKYLEMVLRSPKSIEFYRSKLTGTVNRRGHMSDADFLSMDIPLPDRDTQSKILKTMKQTTSVLYSRQQQLAKLDELIKARFVEMFGDMLLNSLEWPEKPLEGLADIVSGITKGRKTTETGLIEVPYMAVSNVKSGYIDWTTIKTILATKQEIEQYRLMPDDILMTEGGDPDKVGRGAIIKNPLKDSIHQNHIFRVRLDKSELLPAYFAEYLQHQKAKRYFLGCAKQTTGIASINMRQLRALPVLIPPLPLQNQFADFVAEVDKSKLFVGSAVAHKPFDIEFFSKSTVQRFIKEV